MGRCPHCEGEVSDTARKCRHCGEWLSEPGEPDSSSGEAAEPDLEKAGSSGGILSGLASLVVPGLGQLLQGRVMKAGLLFVAALMMWVAYMGWVVHLFAAYDAAVRFPFSKAVRSVDWNREIRFPWSQSGDVMS